MANINTKFISASDVADYNTAHSIHLPEFQPGILDLMNREVLISSRIQTTPATGHPTRYWEQTKLPQNSTFVDPRTGVSGGSYGITAIDADYGRVEKSAMLKAMVSRIKFSLFDKEVVQQQGVMEMLLAKDMNDMMVQMFRSQDNAIWNGTATDLLDTTHKDYCGILKQINKLATIAVADTTTKMSTTIRTEVAKMVARLDVSAFPTAIYANPLTIDLIEQEELADNANFRAFQLEIAPGVVVNRISTQRGFLPLIPDNNIAVTDATTKYVHKIVLLNEQLIERHYLTSSTPRVFKMGVSTTLEDDYIALLFDTLIVKGGTVAHGYIEKEVAQS